MTAAPTYYAPCHSPEAYRATLTAECLRKVDEAETAKAGWDRLAAKHNGTPSAGDNREPATGPWAAQIEQQHAQAAVRDGGDAKSSANNGWGRFLPDRA